VKEYLVYVVDKYPPGQGQMIFYDPDANKHIPILPEFNVFEISISIDNRLVFSSSAEGNSNIYIIDYPFISSIPVNITQENNLDNYPISWSPDGEYLAFLSRKNEESYIQIWNGENIAEIYQTRNLISEFTWDTNHHLAFTEFSSTDDQAEIFIWDENQVVSVSQNPSGYDRYPTWSRDGQLAFLSQNGKEWNIFVWDGVTKDGDTPDTSSFRNIAPNLIGYASTPAWSYKNTLTFTGQVPFETTQIYEWDGKKAHNISQNLEFNNIGQQWANNGYWAFVTFFSNKHLIYIRDENNQTILTTEGQYTPAWSQNGYLMFCTKASSGWRLSIWNGEKVIEIANGPIISAQWRSGKGVYCSSG